MTGNSAYSAEPYSVFVKDGAVSMAFHPLLLTNHGRENAVTAQLQDGFLVISFYNYQGAARSFVAEDLRLTGGGFIAEIGEGSLQKSGFTLEDTWQANMHLRFTTMRKISYKKGDLSLECEYSPATEGVKMIAVNGRAPMDTQLSMSGFDVNSLPFIK
jgi:hypothetical protein